ncbi:YicC/YloC family endoribonuclease [Sulfitobacter aestuarii]|uniref:YicC/YloC family endoribonuclease n=1 Tax=Sulfitobacter aestuarii TaxID=2161676 RepID=A0ABW5U1R0_9RHOB
MIRSMTGYASGSGVWEPFSWSWELRAVNGKGLDLRLRVPDWIEGLEAGLRKQIGATATRGNITCNLRLAREDDSAALGVNIAQLDNLLAAMHEIERRAMDAGLSLAPSKASDILFQRGVLEQASREEDNAALARALLSDFVPVLTDFDHMRAREGAALEQLLLGRLDEIEALVAEAGEAAEERRAEMKASLRRNLALLLDNADGLDETRLTQELALIAVKTDVTEEIDRLAAHVAAARELIAQGGAVGRKLDFLMQEFNREANTLCAKAQSSGLTRIGLALKAVIDQMREQVQNVE